MYYFFFFIFTHSLFASVIQLESDAFKYDELNSQIHAFGNVKLTFNDVVIRTTSLYLNTNSNYITTTSNVTLQRGENIFQSSSLYLDLDEESVELSNLYFTMKPDGVKKGKLHVRLKNLIEKQDVKIGKHGVITTCDITHDPHHYVRAWRFRYVPEKRVHLFMGYIHNKFTFFPFNVIPVPVPVLEFIPFPYYHYAIGKRRFVWNFPVISKKDKKGWGWIVQNSVDTWAFGDEGSLLIDYFQEKPGRVGKWGLGVDQKYKIGKFSGNLYWYEFKYKEWDYSKNDFIKKENSTYSIDNTYTVNDYLSFSQYYKDVDVDEKINSSGKKKDSTQKYDLNYDKFGNKFNSQHTKTHNEINNSKSTRYKFNRSHYNRVNYDSSYTKSTTSGTRPTELKNINYSLNRKLFETIDFNQSLHYSNSDQNKLDHIKGDEQLTSKTTFNTVLYKDKNHFLKNTNLKVTIDYMKDWDEEIVTTDKKEYNYKLPEITLTKSSYDIKPTNTKTWFTGSTIFRFGHYKERENPSSSEAYQRYSYNKQNQNNTNSLNKPRHNPYKINSIEPNAYYIKQTLSRSFNYKKKYFDSTFSLSPTFEQWVFKNENVALFKGDAQNKFSLTTSHRATLLQFIETNVSYAMTDVPDESNSPFQRQSTLRKINATKTKSINYQLNFFYQKGSQFSFRWENKTGYDFKKPLTKWSDYQTSLKLNFYKKLDIKMSTAKNINEQTIANQFSRYKPLNSTIIYKPYKDININYQLNIDTNQWRYFDHLYVINSNFKLNFYIGKTEKYKWKITTKYTYNTKSQVKYVQNKSLERGTIPKGSLNFDRYQMDTLSLTKEEHMRKLKISYTRSTEEIKITYIFNIFPEDPIEIRKKKDVWTLEGRLKKGTIERFK